MAYFSEEDKPWYQSRTIIGALLSLVAMVVGGLFHINIDTSAVTGLADAIVGIVGLVGVVLTIIGRIKASVSIRR